MSRASRVLVTVVILLSIPLGSADARDLYKKSCGARHLQRIANDFEKSIEPPLRKLRDDSLFPGAQVKGAELLDLASRIKDAARAGNSIEFHRQIRDFL